jgi:hypothetical protein
MLAGWDMGVIRVPSRFFATRIQINHVGNIAGFGEC